MPVAQPFDADVLSCDVLAPRVRRLVLMRRDGQPMAFDPGQWVNVILPTRSEELRRAYSIASAPDGSPQFELAVTEVQGGSGSSYLCGLTAGATLHLVGPQGFFTRTAADSSPALFVATGTGVTQLRSMLRAAVSVDLATPLWLLLGARNEEDLLYRAEFETLVRHHPNLRVFFTLSQPATTWTGLKGYVQLHVPALWEELVAVHQGEPHLFVCGLERMVSVVRNLARKSMNLPRGRVHSERYD